MFEDSPANKVNIADLCAGKKVILFAVPGAFTPGCSKVNINSINFYSILLKDQSTQVNRWAIKY